MKEARYYKALGDGRVRCTLCPHECLLADGTSGLCRSRVNKGGRLFSLAYGNVCALAVDPVEKKPLLHFHPAMKCLSLAATGCNFRCLNCQNYEISQAAPADVPEEPCSPEMLVDYCLSHHIPAIAYTYTEPLTYLEYVSDIASLARRNGIYNILVSAGYVNREPLADLAPLLDAANIDLKAFDDNTYHRVNGGSLQPVLDTLLALKSAGVWVEVTNLLIPGINDDMKMIGDMCSWLMDNGFSDNPLHFSRFFPMYRMTDRKATPLASLIEARAGAMSSGLKYVYIGNAPEISDGENTRCPACGALLVERHGYHVDIHNLSHDGRCTKCGARVSGCW